MNDFSSEYRCRSDEELLQLWVERSQLTPEARGALGDEIRKRALTREAESATDAWAEPPQRELAPPLKLILACQYRGSCGVRCGCVSELGGASRPRPKSNLRFKAGGGFAQQREPN